MPCLYSPTLSTPTIVTLQEFLSEWHSDSPTIRVRTSGSTGTPKEMLVEKERMMHSARMTCDFLHLGKADTALLCMPLDYIAGKMMVVRSIVSGMHLKCIVPSSHPLDNIDTIPDFIAMTPMQVAKTMENPVEMDRFCNVRTVIIGGGTIDTALEERLRKCPNAVWSTYGMTETLSHIAMRRVSGPEASLWYTPLSGVSIMLSSDSTLIIDAPLLHEGVLHTNDIAEMNAEGQFRIIGRRDNTINTGGIKVQIEEVENSIKKDCPSVHFIITSRPDPLFGETIVALLPENADEMAKKAFSEAVGKLPRYWQPKSIVFVAELPTTETGKPDRAKAKAIAAKK